MNTADTFDGVDIPTITACFGIGDTTGVVAVERMIGHRLHGTGYKFLPTVNLPVEHSRESAQGTAWGTVGEEFSGQKVE